jgi:hypothetical protein
MPKFHQCLFFSLNRVSSIPDRSLLTSHNTSAPISNQKELSRPLFTDFTLVKLNRKKVFFKIANDDLGRKSSSRIPRRELSAESV